MEESWAQRDSRRGDTTRESESDSGDSLFFTQSVSSPSRTVKRHRPSIIPSCPSSQESEDERKRDPNPTAQHDDTRPRSDSDSETDYNDLLQRWSSVNRRPRRRMAPPKRMVLPFLRKSGFGLLSACKSQTIVNSEIGGFFKCILKLSKGHGEKRRRELTPSVLSSESEENDLEENEVDVDIRKVDTDCFIRSAHKRNRQTWLPSLKGKTKEASRKFNEKSSKYQEDQGKCNQTRIIADDPREPQDDTDVHNGSRSFNIEVTPSRKRGKKIRKSPARTSVSPCSSQSLLPSDKSPFIRSMFLENQEEHGENQPQVLVTCSQSQLLEARKTYQASENLKAITEVAVEETQWQSLEDEDEDETQILDFQINPGVHHEPVENEDVGSVGAFFSSSQDLFEEPNNEPSPLRKNRDEDSNKDLVLRDSMDSVIKKKKRHSLILPDVESTCVKNSKSKKTRLSEISSPAVGGIHKGRKAKDKKTSDDCVDHAYPSLPLEDSVSGSRGNDYSRPNKDVLMVGREEETETPLFVYGGLKFLKRKKGKKLNALEISDNQTPIQADPGQNESSVPHFDDVVEEKKRKKVKNDGLLEEPVATMTEISVPADLSPSPQDCLVVCASRDGNKPKKKRKKDKNGGLLEEGINPMTEISIATDSGLSVQETSMVCSSFSGSKPKKKRKKDRLVLQEDQSVSAEEAMQVPCQRSASLVSITEETEQLTGTDLSSPSISHKVYQGNVTPVKDLVESDMQEPRRKRKNKIKKIDSSSVTADQMVVQHCSDEPHLSLGTDTVKKKKKTFVDDVEGQLKEMVSYNHERLEKISEIPAGIEILAVNSMGLMTDGSVTPVKKKKKRKQQQVVRDNVDNEASLVETTEDVETLDAIQDSEQQKAAELVLTRKVKKRKRKMERSETTQEEEACNNASLSLGFGDVVTLGNSPSTRRETGGIAEEDVPGSELVKKKKKRKKELESYGSVCHGLEYLHDSHCHNAEQLSVKNEASGSGHTENPAPCTKTHLTNDSIEEKQCEVTKCVDPESSQQVLQSEDSIQLKKKKKKKKRRWGETDREVEVVDYDFCQESGFPSELAGTVIEKKKKKKKKKSRSDTVDVDESERLDVPPEDPSHVSVTCHAKEDNISSSGGELLGHIKKKKKKKRIRDSINDLEATVEAEVSVPDESNPCSRMHSAKPKKKRKKDQL